MMSHIVSLRWSYLVVPHVYKYQLLQPDITLAENCLPMATLNITTNGGVQNFFQEHWLTGKFQTGKFQLMNYPAISPNNILCTPVKEKVATKCKVNVIALHVQILLHHCVPTPLCWRGNMTLHFWGVQPGGNRRLLSLTSFIKATTKKLDIVKPRRHWLG